MSAKLHHTVLPIDAVAATSAATGYPASNLLTPSVGKPWRSTSTSGQNIDIDLGTARTAPVIGIQGANAASCTLSYGSTGYTDTSAGTQTLSLDRHGRRKASLALAGSVRYIRLVFGAAAPDDGAAYFQLGALHIFGSTLTLAEAPLIGSDTAGNFPQTRIDLPNGNAFAIDRGSAWQRITLRFRPLRTVDMEEVQRKARAATCWLDLDDTASRELQWPVRSIEGEQGRSLARALQDELSIVLREVA